MPLFEIGYGRLRKPDDHIEWIGNKEFIRMPDDKWGLIWVLMPVSPAPVKKNKTRRRHWR